MPPTVAASTTGDDPPPFLRLASHPLRWGLLQALVQSDRAVRELMTLVDEPQSLVSYHLRLLRTAVWSPRGVVLLTAATVTTLMT